MINITFIPLELGSRRFDGAADVSFPGCVRNPTSPLTFSVEAEYPGTLEEYLQFTAPVPSDGCEDFFFVQIESEGPLPEVGYIRKDALAAWRSMEDV